MARHSVAEYFWSKVRKADGDGCWLWTGTIHYLGYGQINISRRFWRAHRLSWVLTNGPIPDGLFVCHHCDIPACVRPEHLFLGTPQDNSQDMVKKGRAPRNLARRTTLTPDDVRAIRIDPRIDRVVAADYGLRRLAVWEIKHRKTWAWID